jgi:hypothetical protein
MNQAIMNRHALMAFLFACVVAGTGNAFAKDLKLSDDSPLTRVVIRKSDWSWLAVKWIDDPVQLKSLAAFFKENLKGWSESPFGSSPDSSLGLDLFSGTNYIERLGVGEDYLVCGSLQKVSKQQAEELRKLIGKIPETLSEVVLPAISGIKEIIVTTNLSGTVKGRIEEPHKINRVVEFINQHRTGWSEPWSGKLIPNVILELRNQTGFVVEFGVGEDFLESCDDGMFTGCRSKQIARDQRDKILKLLNSPSPY